MQTVKLFFLSFLLFAPAFKGSAGDIKMPAAQNTIKFTENKNQWDKNVLYRAQLDGGALFLEKGALVYNFYDKETLRENHAGSGKHGTPGPIRSHAFKTTFVNSLKTVQTSAQQMSPDYCNYFLGKDKSKWAGNVRNFREVNYKGLYKGIDMQVLSMENSVKYNFIVSPQGEANEIRLNYEGLDKISLHKGALVLKTSVNEIMEERPYAYQQINGIKAEVPCEFVLTDNTIQFSFPKGFNKAYELVIDPILVFACSSGSTADNFGMTATYDARGNLYSGGTCFDIGFPVTLGAYDLTFNGLTAYGRTDVVITKYDSAGAFLQYSTYIGGATGTEIVTSLVVDAQNNLLLYGATGSSDFPVTATAYDTTFGGGLLLHFVYNGSYFDNGTDIYVAKLDPAGANLLASTYIGGHMNDGVNVNNDSIYITAIASWEFPPDSLQYNYGDQYRGEINVDQYGNAYIASSTRSDDFPVVNGFDATLGGEQDAVAFKLNSDFSQLLWSTYLGGTDNDAGYALALDDSANVYITGGTRSNNFPATAGALQTSYGGGKADGYIAKIKKDGTALLFSTYWGTALYDQTYFVQLDKDNDVYVVGQTKGSMPVTAGVYSNPNSGQFITKMNDSLNTLIFSTVFGNGNGSPNISPSAFLVDYCENIYVSGWGGNIITGPGTTGMPVTPGAIQPASGDGFNFYLFVLSTDATSLLYATYFGGNLSREHVDGGTSRFDKKGIIYQSVCAGCGGNDDFPVTPGSWPGTGTNVNHASNCNNGTFKFDFQVAIADANFTVDYISGCAPLTVQFQNQSTTGGSYLWDFGAGDTTSTVLNPVHVFPNPGTYMVQLLVYNPASCNMWDTALQYVTVYPAIAANFNYTSPQCTYLVNFFDSSAVAPVSWLWNFGDGDSSLVQDPIHDYDSTGTFTVQLISTTVNGCADTASMPVTFYMKPSVSITPSDTICLGTSINLLAAGGYSFIWSPATGLSDPLIGNPVATPLVSTSYSVLIQTVDDANDTCTQTLYVNIFVQQDLAAFTSDTSLGCSPLTVQFTNLGSSTSEYLWDFGNGNTSSTTFNPAQVYTTGTYTVQLYSRDTASCGIWDTVAHNITVNPGIMADFDFVSVPCTDQFLFHDSSSLAPVSWAWNFGDGGVSTIQDPTHLFPSAGNYSVELVAANSFGCKDTTSVSLNYNGVTTTISPDDTVCIEHTAAQLNATGGFSYSWLPASSLSAANISNPIAHPLATTTYTVSISTINSLGDTCQQTQSTTVYVIDPSVYPLSATADSDTIPEGTSTIIHAITDTNFTVHWNPVAGVSDPLSFHPSVSPGETTTYTVSIMDSTGCMKTASVTIVVVSMQCKPENVFVPNTFTPNNDGMNDVLYVRSNDIEELYFAVYNRWGQMVFETTDIKRGWDGYYNGMQADPAVFAWYLRAKCFNGNEIRKKGNTTLIR